MVKVEAAAVMKLQTVLIQQGDEIIAKTQRAEPQTQ
jgi:hypothetical protein